MSKQNLVVLVVEDSLIILERIFSLLEENEDVKMVVHAANYQETLKMMEKIRADVILLDINLPDKSGVEILKEIKKEKPEVKIVILTNHATEDYRQLCINAGADFFLDKSNDFGKIPQVLSSMT